MRLFITLISFLLLTACASTPMSVYRDHTNTTEIEKPIIIKVREDTSRALSTLAYRMGVLEAKDGYIKTSTLNPIFNRSSVLEKYKDLTIPKGKWISEHVDFLANFTKSNAALNNEDVSIFELKIIGISSGIETVVKKRFVGPVKRFNWVKFFENKVPEDKLGYLLAGTAYINYIPIFGSQSRDYEPAEIEKEHKQYLIPIPIIFSAEREYKGKRYEGVMQPERGYIFGKSAQYPMAQMTYTNDFLKTQVSQSYYYKNIKDDRRFILRRVGAHTFYSGSNLLDSLQIITRSWDDDGSITAKALFKNAKVKIGGKLYSNFYLLNDKFVRKNLFINRPYYKDTARNKNIRETAMHLAYKDDSALHEINQVMSEARSALGQLSDTCERGIKRTNRHSKALRHFSSSRRYEAYSRYYYHFANVRKRMIYYHENIAKASKRFSKLATKPGGIQASTNSLENYNTEVSMVPMSMNSAKVFCGKLGNTVSALGSGSSKKTQSFMSILGGALQNSYRNSISSMDNARANQSLYNNGYNSSSSTSGRSGVSLRGESYPSEGEYKPSGKNNYIPEPEIKNAPRVKFECIGVPGFCPEKSSSKTPISGGAAR